MIVNDLLTAKETSKMLGVKIQTLACWRMKKEFLPFCRIGRLIRYRKEDIERWIEKRVISPGQN
jgi:excisionase family DNA binding protein